MAPKSTGLAEGRRITPDNPAFNKLLAETVAVWGTYLEVEQWVEEGKLRVQARYGGETVEYSDPLLEGRVVTPIMAASALWGITSVCWRCRTVEAFCEFMSNPAPEGSKLTPEHGGAQMFEDWVRVGRECVRIFGEDFGNNQRLRERANGQ